MTHTHTHIYIYIYMGGVVYGRYSSFFCGELITFSYYIIVVSCLGLMFKVGIFYEKKKLSNVDCFSLSNKSNKIMAIIIEMIINKSNY